MSSKCMPMSKSTTPLWLSMLLLFYLIDNSAKKYQHPTPKGEQGYENLNKTSKSSLLQLTPSLDETLRKIWSFCSSFQKLESKTSTEPLNLYNKTCQNVVLIILLMVWAHWPRLLKIMANRQPSWPGPSGPDLWKWVAGKARLAWAEWPRPLKVLLPNRLGRLEGLGPVA